MSGYVLTPLPKADIFDVWSYIAEDNERAADRWKLSPCFMATEHPAHAEERS
jgi:hypothetical protein